MTISRCRQCGRSTGGITGEYCEDCYAERGWRYSGKSQAVRFEGKGKRDVQLRQTQEQYKQRADR